MSDTSSASWHRAPEVPVAAPNLVHVWRVDLDADARPDAEREALCSPEEGARAALYATSLLRRRFKARRAALRTILGRYLAVAPADLRFAAGVSGKPALAGPAAASDIRFNASGSGRLALVAVTRSREVGVDIEKVRPDIDMERIARQFFTPADAHLLRSLEPAARIETFFNCWCRTEALLKAAGVGLGAEPGLSAPPEELGAWSVSSIDIDPGFVAALAVEGPVGRIVRFLERGAHAAGDG